MATTIFGSERRLIRREDGVLPFLQPDYEPGPGEYGIEMQTRMSYELEQKNMSPGHLPFRNAWMLLLVKGHHSTIIVSY